MRNWLVIEKTRTNIIKQSAFICYTFNLRPPAICLTDFLWLEVFQLIKRPRSNKTTRKLMRKLKSFYQVNLNMFLLSFSMRSWCLNYYISAFKLAFSSGVFLFIFCKIKEWKLKFLLNKSDIPALLTVIFNPRITLF